MSKITKLERERVKSNTVLIVTQLRQSRKQFS